MASPAPMKISMQPSGQAPGQMRALQGASPDERAIELAKRSLETPTIDELYFLLVNDTRALIEYERAWLITHIGGGSRLAATNNQPAVNKKSEFVERSNRLATCLRGHDKALFLSSRILKEDSLGDKVSADLKEALKAYMAFSGFQQILILPLVHNDSTVAHLTFEFAEGKIPREADILAVLNVTTFFAAALVERHLLEEKPELASLIRPQENLGKALASRYRKWLPVGLVAAIVLVAVFFLIPFPFTVGGEAEIVCRQHHFAFAGLDGIIDEVVVKEGDTVEKGQLLARLDPKEIDYQITNWKSQYQILSQEMARLSMESGDVPARLVERKVTELKRDGAWNELQYLKWKREFLDIRSPVAGVILTKDVQALTGKKLNHGEPFCEIAAPEELMAQIYVPEDRISHVVKGQDTYLYLNSEPARGFAMKLEEVAPAAEARPRLGNVYRARAPFVDHPKSLKVGMKGIGKIHTADASLWTIVTSQLHTRWNQLCLHF